MKRIFENRDWQSLIPDQSIFVSKNPENSEYNVGSFSSAGGFLIAYLSYGRETTISTQKLNAIKLAGWLFNPRDGRSISLGSFENTGSKIIKPHSEGRGGDWVVIIEDANKNYINPGLSGK